MNEKQAAIGAKPVLLIVDDDPLIVDTLSFVLSSDFEVIEASSRRTCIERLRGLRMPAQLALIDLGLPPRPHRPEEGFALIADLLAHSPTMKIVVLSGQNDEVNARHARTLGATDFVGKPADPARIRDLLLAALSFSHSENQNAVSADGLVGESPPLQKLRAQILQFADSPFPVLIEGESGSGKEVVANTLHAKSTRNTRPFFALNCAAIAPTLVEPTLFGYARGAFTGATGAKTGYFEDAADGALFLDEIGELPLELQSKLLRVLENGEYQRVGETQTRKSRARVIAATNRDLRLEVREGRFRADLYHRLSVFSLLVPALRDLGTDRLLLLEHFQSIYASAARSPGFTLSRDARKLWVAYPFPGNVRELRNVVIRLTAKYGGKVVEASDLANEFESQDEVNAAAGVSDITDALIKEIEGDPEFTLDTALSRREKAYIDAAQRIARGNISQTARILGLSRSTLYDRMDALKRSSPENKR